ncbi:hypothetical protein CspHIS471_0101390 [Cutaneotrichosporon sp. HIS471]|nr:hypothetical protein CspHIS471_0101390 [Cutaneotrichosporon sp. HIS471]
MSSNPTRRSSRARHAPTVFGNAVSSDQKYGSDDEISIKGDPEDEYESPDSTDWAGTAEEESLEARLEDEEPKSKRAKKAPKEKEEKAPKGSKSKLSRSSASKRTTKTPTGVLTKSVARKPTKLPQKVGLNELAGSRAVAKAGAKLVKKVVPESGDEGEDVAAESSGDQGCAKSSDKMDVHDDAGSAVSSDAEGDTPPSIKKTVAKAPPKTPAKPGKVALASKPKGKPLLLAKLAGPKNNVSGTKAQVRLVANNIVRATSNQVGGCKATSADSDSRRTVVDDDDNVKIASSPVSAVDDGVVSGEECETARLPERSRNTNPERA